MRELTNELGELEKLQGERELEEGRTRKEEVKAIASEICWRQVLFTENLLLVGKVISQSMKVKA